MNFAAIAPPVKKMVIDTISAFGVAAAERVYDRIRKSREEQTINDDGLRVTLDVMTTRALEAEARADAEERRAEVAMQVATQERYLRWLLVRWILPMAVLIALAAGVLIGWLAIP